MAGTNPLTDPKNRQGDSVPAAIKNHYEIEYARLFNYPKAPSRTSARLRPLSRSNKLRQRGGTWLSSSTASLHILTGLTSQSLPELVLIVSVRGKIHEEHFISKLHFSWPQVSCVSQCPVRGSRVVFASYKDCLGQIQKFALQFSESCESQTFFNSLKESLKDVRNIELLGSNFGLEISSQMGAITSNGIYNGAYEEMNHLNPVGNTTLMQSSMNDRGMEHMCSEETTLPCEFGGMCATLPPSFTALLADCCTEAEQEAPKLPEEPDLKFHLSKYMTSSSFNDADYYISCSLISPDMLSKIENVISILGGDLAL